jgi:septal ring factor EnvC (AmiA/AmiB activator)
MLLGTIVPELQGEAEALVAKLDQLKELEATISLRKEDVAREIARLTSERAGTSERWSTRSGHWWPEGAADLEAERKRTAELAEKAKSLKQLLSQLDAERQKQDAAKAEEQRQREQQEAMLRQPKLPFPDAKGKLAFPAPGRHRAPLRRAGRARPRTSQGLMIATRASAQVTTRPTARWNSPARSAPTARW